MKIVVSTDYGGFWLSEAALAKYNEYAGRDIKNDQDIPRNDPILVRVIEEMNPHVGSELGIVVVPDDVKWVIEEYEGTEWVAEVHRCWYAKRPS